MSAVNIGLEYYFFGFFVLTELRISWAHKVRIFVFFLSNQYEKSSNTQS